MFVFNNHRKGFVIIFCTLLASMEFYPSTVISVPWLHICWQTIVMTATCRYLFCRHRHIGYCSWTLFLRPFHCVMLSKTLSFPVLHRAVMCCDLATNELTVTWSDKAECSTVDFTDWQLLLLLLLFTYCHRDRYFGNVVVKNKNDCSITLQNTIAS